MKQFHPSGNLVVLQPIPQFTTTAGLLLVDKYKRDQQLWTVIAVGPGRRTRKGQFILPDVLPGDKVLTPGIPNVRHTWDDGVVIMDADEILLKF